ncbi:hypothetical protein GWO09_21010 [candidate division KSB1 bacterium]|nr:hypothetical protein [candidate division KSB1 bacterium]
MERKKHQAMKAPLSEKIRTILRNPKDAKVFVSAVRNRVRVNGEAEIKLPSGRKVRVRQLRVVER